MFDLFLASLRCPNCHSVAIEAEIQTHIRNGSANGSALILGFELDPADLTTDSILDSGYMLVREPASGSPIRLLDVWNCPHCYTEQWAVIEISARRVRGIEAVTLDRATLGAANFISEVNAQIRADSLRDARIATEADSVAILRQRLP